MYFKCPKCGQIDQQEVWVWHGVKNEPKGEPFTHEWFQQIMTLRQEKPQECSHCDESLKDVVPPYSVQQTSLLVWAKRLSEKEWQEEWKQLQAKYPMERNYELSHERSFANTMEKCLPIPKDMQCYCDIPPVKRQVRKAGKNLNRWFYCCPKKQSDSCGYFQWC